MLVVHRCCIRGVPSQRHGSGSATRRRNGSSRRAGLCWLTSFERAVRGLAAWVADGIICGVASAETRHQEGQSWNRIQPVRATRFGVEIPKPLTERALRGEGLHEGERPSLADFLESNGLRVVTSKRLLVYA